MRDGLQQKKVLKHSSKRHMRISGELPSNRRSRARAALVFAVRYVALSYADAAERLLVPIWKVYFELSFLRKRNCVERVIPRLRLRPSRGSYAAIRRKTDAEPSRQRLGEIAAA
jgi:hypothetical protein